MWHVHLNQEEPGFIGRQDYPCRPGRYGFPGWVLVKNRFNFSARTCWFASFRIRTEMIHFANM